MGRTGRSVTASVVAGFAVCILAVGILVARATDAAFEHEREDAEAALVAASDGEGLGLGQYLGSAVPLIEDLAADPRFAAFDGDGCDAALAPFASIGSQARIVVLDPLGAPVCTLPEGSPAGALPSALYRGALAGDVVETGRVFIDGVRDEAAVAVAAPVLGADGTGAILGILFTDEPSLEPPLGVDEATVIVAVDTATQLVLTTTAGAPYTAGETVTWTEPPAVGPDGVERIWRTTFHPPTGWTVSAGLDTSVALAVANEQRRSLLLMGAAILGLVIVLAVALQRRLARPIRRLGSAIAASRAGDEAVRAPEAGPTEIVEVARAFNELVDAHQDLTDQLRRTACHDPLTGLLNRRGATEELVRLIDDPTASPLVVLFIDLDRFKLVNDSHGHTIGDELLFTLAGRLRAAVPPHWLVTRFGGDEFVVICPNTADPIPHVEALGDVLRSTIRVGLHELTVGGSTGIAVARPGQTVDDLIREADTAMYRAKDRGRGGYATFDEEMRAWTIARLSTESELRDAIDRDELVLHFQPVVDVATGAVTGAEALIRWEHPDQGLLAPVSFIPIAEETDLILEIGAWVMSQAAVQAATWRAAGTPVRVAVNVAAAQLLRTDLTAIVTEAFAAAGADVGDLTIEVTESAVLSDIEATVAQLEAVRRLGARVSLDDFGTGYSSLAYLQRLPVDELKIDRSFVSAIADDRVSAAIVASVLDLAHAVGLDVVAEGVETREQLELLRGIGCDHAQGYYLARPALPAALRMREPLGAPVAPPPGSRVPEPAR
jgi:diguanylate cyclase (GGDEF)-like protein